MERNCPYCEQLREVKQRMDYAGNAAGMMCDDCWKTSGLNPEKMAGHKKDNVYQVEFRKK